MNTVITAKHREEGSNVEKNYLNNIKNNWVMKKVKDLFINRWAYLIGICLQLSFSTCYAQGEGLVPDAVEHAALVDLYNNLDGPNWTNKTNWLQGTTNTDFENWWGVSTSNGDVTGISLPLNNLMGSIPSTMGNLTALVNLNLHTNQITGTIPTEVGDLINLSALHLHNNQLIGNIPTSLGNLSNLTVLELNFNSLSGDIPASLGNLNNLERLYLYSNQLTGSIPATLGNLVNLKHLIVSSNQLSGSIPATLGNLTNLVNLNLRSNQLTGNIPTELGGLSNLSTMYLFHNRLSGDIPSSLSNLSNLTILDLHYNNLSGSIPSNLGNLNNLRELYLYNNQLTGAIPSSLGNLINLKHLIASTNQLSGSIPSSLGNLVNLISLNLHTNQLTGSIPVELGNLANLSTLYLYTNQLSGSIPSSLGNLTGLIYLHLNSNALSGTIPSSIGNLSNLIRLRLSWNNLSGEIPASIGNLANLKELLLFNNQLGGSIPSTVGQLSNLGILHLQKNSLAGNIPDEIGNMNSLYSLYLTSNNLSGTIPNAIGNLTGLQFLHLDDNSFGGTIPNSIGNLNNLRRLRLHFNNLSGEIPESIGNLTSLQELLLYNNQLIGSLPPTIGRLSNLGVLHLQTNSLTGGIPYEIGNLNLLYSLNLSGNQLSGAIPNTIGNLSELLYLYLENNLLTGNIPASIGNLNSLIFLRLQFNNLSGEIPVSASNLTNLTQLFLYNNNFASFPSFAGNTNASNLTVNIKNNKIVFEGLESNFTAVDQPIFGALIYAPQSTVGTSQTIGFQIGNPVTLTFQSIAFNNQYQWQKFNGTIWQDVFGATTNNYTIANTTAGDIGTQYRCKITNTRATQLTLYTESYTLAEALPPIPNQALNYIISNTITEKGVTEDNAINNLAVEQLDRTVDYFDGLGRPIQSVIVQGSPRKNDVVQHREYDAFGRENKEYLPYTAYMHEGNIKNNGSFKEDPLGDLYTFYYPGNNSDPVKDVAREFHKYALKVFEPSPLNRLIEQGAVGNPWQPNLFTGKGKTLKFRYHTNIANQVRLWELTAGTQLPTSTTHYAPNELMLNETEDEHGAETHEFVDKLGRTVLKEVENVISNTQVEWLQTYYVYDEFNNLRYVFPPKATRLLGDGNFTPSGPDDPILKNLVFQYHYDGRQRMIMKKVPGAEPVYMVYDQFDRLVFTQDGNQFQDSEWSFTKYDPLNRPVLTGTMTLANSWGTDRMAYRDGVEAGLDTYYTNHLPNDANYRYESYSASDTWGYTDRSYPPLTLGAHEILTVTFYDNYDFIADGRLGTTTVNYGFEPELGLLNMDTFTRVKGQVTGSRTQVLGENKYLNTVIYYDERYRVVQTVTDNYTGGFDRVTTEYDFAGRVLRTQQTHRRGTGSFEDLVVNQSFTYDHASRLLNTYHRINSQDSVLLTANRYNEIGELVEKNLHSALMTNPQFKQSVDYRYNIRGWLIMINNSALTTGGINTGDQAPDYFGMALYYNLKVPGLNYDMTGTGQDPMNSPLPYFEQLLQGLPLKPVISYQLPDIFNRNPTAFKHPVPAKIQNGHKAGWGHKFGVDYRGVNSGKVNPGKIKAKMAKDKKTGIGFYSPRQLPDKTGRVSHHNCSSQQSTSPVAVASGEGLGTSPVICLQEQDVLSGDDDESESWAVHLTPEVFLDVDPATLTASLDGTIWVTGDFTTGVASKDKSLGKKAGKNTSLLSEELWLEAECGTRGPNWTMASDASASNNNYMVMQTGTAQMTTPPSTVADHLSYTFDITTAGDYKVWGRAFTTSANDDSFWVRMDGASWIKWNAIPTGSWLWDDIHDSDNSGVAVTFNLTAGSHTLDIAFREPGAKIDKLYISSTGVAPTGTGQAATNCVATAPPADPTGLVTLRTSFDYITFSWDANAQIVDDYAVERSEDNINFIAVGTVAGNALSFQDHTVQAGTGYYYRIKANNSLGNSGFSTSLNASSLADPGIIKDQLLLYLDARNPASYPGSGNTWYDLSTGTNDATLNAYSFDGTDLSFTYNGTQVITGENLPIAQNQAFSVGFWINPSDNSRPNMVRSSFNVGAFIFGVRSGFPGSIQAGIDNLDENAMIARTDLPAGLLANNQDQYFVYTYENNIASLYKNGQHFISKDIGPMTAAWGKFILSYALGRFNVAQVYGRALTADEVWHNYYMGYGHTSSTVTVPATSTDVVATALSVSQVSLTWSDVATDEVYYLVERSTDGTNFTPLKYLPAGATAHEDVGLNAATAYTYRVTAVNAAGSSAPSANQTATTDPLPVINIVSDGLELYLDAGHVSSYNGAGTGTVWNDISGKNHHATLDEGVAVLSGHLRFNNRGFSAPVPALTAGITNFSVGFWMRPTQAGYRNNNLQASGAEFGNGAFFSRNDAVNFRYVTGVTATNMFDSYSVYILDEWAYFVFTYDNGTARMYKNGVEFSNSPKVQDPVTVDFENLMLKQGYGDFDLLQVYSKTLTAQEVFQNYEIHKNRYFVPTQVPAAPTDLAVNTLGSYEIKITWTDNADNEDKFVVEMASDINGPFTVLDEVIVNVNNYTHDNLTPNQIVYFRVKAENSLGSSGYSNVLTAKTLSAKTTPPLPPTGLSASVQSYNRIRLIWNDVATHEDEYQVESSTDGTNYSVLAVLPFNTSSYEDTGLEPNTTYHYRVAALNSRGSSGYSNTVSGITTSFPDFSVVTSGLELYLDATLTMSYDGSGPDWYDLSGKGNDATLDAGVVKQNGRLHFTDQGFEAPLPGLPAGTTHFSVGFWLRPDAQGYTYNNVSSVNAAHLVGAYYATNESGTRMVTGVLENRFGPYNIYQLGKWVYIVYTYDNGVGRLYRNGTLRDGPANQGPVQVDFQKMIYTKGHGDFEVLQVYNRTLSEAEVLQNYNADKDRYRSTVAIPAAPSGLAASVASKSQINLAWTDNATDEGNYVVEFSTDGGVSYRPLVSLPSAAAAYEHAGLSPGQTVYYRVQAINSTGNSAYSNVVSAATLLEEPAGLSGTPYLSTRIDLSWVDNAENEVGYQIERKGVTEGTYTLVHTTAADVSTHSDAALPTETTYNYRVRAVNGANYSVYTPEITVTTGLTPPTGLSASGVSAFEMDLTWQDNTSAESGYVLERSLSSSSGFEQVASLGANVTAFRDEGLVPETTYFYRLQAVDANGHSDYSNVAGASTLPLLFSNPDLAYKAEPYYNGNISAITWQTYNSGQEQGYTYTYDHVNRIKSASHVYATGTNTWNMNEAGFSVGNIMYDRNGNIQSLKRQAKNLYGVYVLDDLDYSYEDAEVSNRLQAVIDSSGVGEGFKDGNTSAIDYSYDANGNLTSDANKDIASIEYNLLNLPRRIVFADGNEILYTYDAAGTKLRKEVREDVEGTVVKTVTDYTSGVQYTINDYQGAGETTSRDFVMTPEGRATTEDAEAVSTAYNYEYNLTDHLGNVRVTFTTREEQPDEYVATFETNEQPVEALDFQNYGDATIISNTLYNHTAGVGSDQSVRLSGAPGEIIGLAKSLAVVPGDVVHIEAYAKYWSPTANATNLGGILGAVADAFGVANPATPDAQAAYNALSDLFSIGPFLDASDWEDPAAPKAFINYILFDQGYEPYFYEIDQIDITANEDGTDIPHDYLTLTANVTKPGYIYIYLSNENDKLVDTFFDDFKIIHTKSPIISADDYYPFGLQIAQNSYQREGATDQKYKYQGQERQFDFDLDWDMFRFRTHDPAIARFLQVDPLSDDYVYNSPYAFAENKLGLGTELEGAELNLFPWLAADAVVNPSGVGAHSLGILKGLENNVTGLIDAVTHPIETAKGLGNLALLGASQGNAATSIAIDNALGTNSFETGAALGNAIEQGVDNLISGDGLERGEVIGEIAGAVIGAKGTTAATKAVSTAVKANKTVKVFRVFGGDAKAKGFSFTPDNPKSVANFRDAAGLPSGGASGVTNTGRFVIEGTVKNKHIIKRKLADPLDGNAGKGVREFIIDPENVKIQRVSGVNPEF